MEDPLDAENPSVVKVALAGGGRCLYFSRAGIPFFSRAHAASNGAAPRVRHIGIYGFSRKTLERFVRLPPSPLEKAESLKFGNDAGEFSKKKLDEIIEARLCDIFESIENNLKKIKRSELLPAGIVFVGGGANTPLLVELSKSILKLPSNIGSIEIFDNIKTKLRDPSYFTAIGLLISGKNNGSYLNSSFKNFLKDLKNIIKSSLKQLMP